MTNEHILAGSFLNIPDSESGISRAGNSSIRIRHFQATNRRRVAAKRSYRFAVRMLV